MYSEKKLVYILAYIFIFDDLTLLTKNNNLRHILKIEKNVCSFINSNKNFLNSSKNINNIYWDQCIYFIIIMIGEDGGIVKYLI